MPSQRRRFLAAAGSLSIAGLAGCSSVSETLGEEKLQNQKAAVERFVTAVNENDIETVQESVTTWAAGGFTEGNIDQYTLEYGELRRTADDDKSATIKTDLTLTHEEEMQEEETSFQLDKYDGWTISSILFGSGLFINGTVLAPPPIFLESSYNTDATGSDETGVLTLTHGGGGIVPAAETEFNGTIVNPDDVDPEIVTSGTTLAEATDRTRLSPGDELTVGVESEYQVNVTFSKENNDTWVILGSFTP
ncbi:hypothetical protein [Halobaculum rubrum]|uniref:hypothetical protein n=1 Tax=Halobaculum rubrum TaxID=2872158 RepID=UPI001CA3E2FB|nr:hypothetical protein [Halobaculum rubrum]QZX98572.1 hypothetical protein K6T25_09800 [Halobaculum rubrum]